MSWYKHAAGTILLVLLGCSSDLMDENGRPVTSSEWVFVSADGITAADGFMPQLTIHGGKFSGKLGCNHFNGRYKVSGQSLEIELGVRTEIGCARPILERESQMTSLFAAVKRYKIEGRELTLITGDGRQVRFTARIPKASPPLEKTTWKLQSAAEMGMVGTSASIQEVTAVFSNGSVQVSHPCFALTAAYQETSPGVSFRITSSKDLACGKPADMTANAKSIGKLLTESDRLTIVEERLSLRAGSEPRLDFTAGR